MTDLRKLLDIVNDNVVPQKKPELYDSIDFELDKETVIETGIVGLSKDAILLEMDEKGLELLENKGIKFQIPDFNDPEVRKFYDIPTKTRIEKGLSSPTDITDYDTPPSMRDPTRGKPGWVKRRHKLQQMGALPKDDTNITEAHVPINVLTSKRGLEVLFNGMKELWERQGTSVKRPTNDESFLNLADTYVLFFIGRDLFSELLARNMDHSQIKALLEKEPVLVRIRDEIVSKLIPVWHDYHWKDSPLKEGDVVSGPWMYSGETMNIRDLFKMFVKSKFYKGPVKDDTSAYRTVSDVKEFLKEIKKRMPKFKISNNHTDDEIAIAIAMFLYKQGTDQDPYHLKESSHKKVYKLQGEPIGEIGIAGDGEYYVKHYLSGIKNTGYASKSEAVKDLKDMQHSVTTADLTEGRMSTFMSQRPPLSVERLLDEIMVLRLQAKSASENKNYNMLEKINNKIEELEAKIVSKKPEFQVFIDNMYKYLSSKNPNDEPAPPIAQTKTAKVDEAKYRGREVPLGKPMQGDVKKKKVYVRKPNGNVVKVEFGDKKMRIKKSNPKRRKSFRARHRCDNPGPRWKARYWSCRAW